MSGTTILRMLEGKEFVLEKKGRTGKKVNKKDKNKKLEVVSDQKRKRKRPEKKKQQNGCGDKEKNPEDWLKKGQFSLCYLTGNSTY
jgi:hypothetical protein